jgi:hypothetical protein
MAALGGMVWVTDSCPSTPAVFFFRGIKLHGQNWNTCFLRQTIVGNQARFWQLGKILAIWQDFGNLEEYTKE